MIRFALRVGEHRQRLLADHWLLELLEAVANLAKVLLGLAWFAFSQLHDRAVELEHIAIEAASAPLSIASTALGKSLL